MSWRNPPALPPRANLTFVETAAEVRKVLQSPARSQVDAFVALEPDAAWALSEAGIDYLTLEDGYAEPDLCALAQLTLDAQQDWADWVDRFLQERVPEFRNHQFRPAQLYLYWLKILFDSLTIRAHTLDWALRQLNPGRIVYLGAQPADRTFGWDLMYRETIYPAVLRHVVKRLGIEAALPPEPIVSADGLHASASGQPHWNTVSPGKRLIYSLASPARELARDMLDGVSFSGRGAVILGNGYDLDQVWALARRRARLTRWKMLVNRFRRMVDSVDCAEARGWMAQVWNEIAPLPRFRRPVQPAEYDLWTLAEERLHFWWHVLVPQQWSVYRSVRRFFETRPPEAVAVSGVGDQIERGVFGALRSLGVRTYIYQHGGFAGWCECPPWDANDLALTQYELSHGGAMSKYFEIRQARSSRPLAQPITVGSSRLDVLRAEMSRAPRSPNQRPQVLLIPNTIPGNSRYLDCGNLPDVTESELQIAMVSAAREFPEYDFVFKAFPSQCDTPAVSLARQPGSNCRVECAAGLPMLVAQADLIVLNFPSTAMMESLLTDRPMLVLTDTRSIRMFPEAKAALSRRALVVDTPEEFIATLRALLTRGEFQPIHQPDQSFLEMYGTHLNDGQSAQRALAAILDRAPVN